MLKTKLIMPVLLAAALTLILSGCYTRTPEQRAEDMVQHLVGALDLNEAQTAKLESIKYEFLARRPAMDTMREDTVKEANAMMRSPQIDQEKLNALLEKDRVVIDDYVRFIAAKFTEIHDMLTPAQREKLVSMIEDHMKQGHHWHH